MPATDSQDNDGYVNCNYPVESFPGVLDLLRNEKPVYANYVAGGWNMGSIGTSLERAGEGERPPLRRRV